MIRLVDKEKSYSLEAQKRFAVQLKFPNELLISFYFHDIEGKYDDILDLFLLVVRDDILLVRIDAHEHKVRQNPHQIVVICVPAGDDLPHRLLALRSLAYMVFGLTKARTESGLVGVFPRSVRLVASGLGPSTSFFGATNLEFFVVNHLEAHQSFLFVFQGDHDRLIIIHMVASLTDILEQRPTKVGFDREKSIDEVAASDNELFVVLLFLVLVDEDVSLQIGINNEKRDLLRLENVFHHLEHQNNRFENFGALENLGHRVGNLLGFFEVQIVVGSPTTGK